MPYLILFVNQSSVYPSHLVSLQNSWFICMFFRLLWFLVLPLPCLHGFRKIRRELLSPIMWRVQPCHTCSLWDTYVCASRIPVSKGSHSKQIWDQGMMHVKLTYILLSYNMLNKSEAMLLKIYLNLQLYTFVLWFVAGFSL